MPAGSMDVVHKPLARKGLQNRYSKEEEGDVRKVLVIVLMVLVVPGMSFGQAKQIIIGFNNGSTTVDFLRQVGESMEKAAAEYGVKLIVAESNFDAEKILPNVDNLLLQGAQIIVDFNVNAEVGGSLVDYCGAKGVTVIGIDVSYTGAKGEQGWFFGANNQMAGEVAARASRRRSRRSGAARSTRSCCSSTPRTATWSRRGCPACMTA